MTGTMDTWRAGQRLGLTAYEVEQLCRRGELEHTRNGARHFRITPEAIEAYQAGHLPAGTPSAGAGPSAAAEEDADVVIPVTRSVVLTLRPLVSEEPVATRLRRLRDTAASLDLAVVAVGLEPEVAA